MQSNGGLTTAEAAAATPMHIIESGPAAGVVGVQALARRIGIDKAISFDMGGTTAKASLIENGELTRATEYQVGAGIVLGSRLLSGAGYTLKVPAIDLAEVGAGGGSILWIDSRRRVAGRAAQRRRVAGAGVLRPGRHRADRDRRQCRARLHQPGASGRRRAEARRRQGARRRSPSRIARPLGMSVEEAAYGAHLIAASNMIRALKAVSSERGRDPREYALVAFGGNGPIFAAGMAEAMRIPQVLIPPSAGVFSSFGLLYAEVEYHFARTRKRLLRDAAPERIAGDRRCARSRGAGAAVGGRVRTGAHRDPARRQPALPGPVVRVARAARCRPARPRRRWRRSKKRSAPSTSAPTAIAPGSRSRSSWSASRSIGRGIPETPRAASAAAAEPRARHRDRRAAPAAPISGRAQRLARRRIVNRSDLRTPHPGPCIVEEYDVDLPRPAGLDRPPRRIRQYRAGPPEMSLEFRPRAAPDA